MTPCELCFVRFCGKGWPLTLAGICPAREALYGRNTRTPGEASASSGRPQEVDKVRMLELLKVQEAGW